jgi:hypothetical protein
MTAKIDGTNGVLQAYDYQTPTTGFSYTFPAGVQTLLMVPAGTLATGTVTMPAAPSDGMMVTLSSTQQITALTLQGNTGQTVSSAVTLLPAKGAASYVYRLSNTTWYPSQSVFTAGSQLVSGTSQASTSGTSIDFTGIPSWAKRVTMMLNGVSTGGTSLLQAQLGYPSTYATSGYNSVYGVFAGGTSGTTAASSGCLISTSATASASVYGNFVFTLLTGNTWTFTFNGVDTNGTRVMVTGGSIALSGVLDRIRLTTVNGTDTFDAGSINILYE